MVLMVQWTHAFPTHSASGLRLHTARSNGTPGSCWIFPHALIAAVAARKLFAASRPAQMPAAVCQATDSFYHYSSRQSPGQKDTSQRQQNRGEPYREAPWQWVIATI